MTDLQPGWPVMANDGRQLGTIKEVGQNYLQTSPAANGPDLYVPASAISNVSDGVVQLNLALAEARNMGWEQAPRADDTLETSREADVDRHV